MSERAECTVYTKGIGFTCRAFPGPNCDACKYPHEIWADERADVLNRFTEELAKATGDGSKKRQAGTKPPWYEDDSHEGAMFSHLTKWKRGELVDPDSGAHPLVHLAWRALAVACRESGNVPPSFPSN